MKFKVGDKVRRIKCSHHYGAKIGDIGVITEIRDDDSVWIGDVNHSMSFLELVEELKHGDIVYASDYDPECKEKQERILSSIGHVTDRSKYRCVFLEDKEQFDKGEEVETFSYKYCVKKKEPVVVDIVSDGKAIGRIRKDSIDLGGE